MPPRRTSVDVFDYLDYRAFLRDLYLEKKTSGHFSFRAFSRTAGLRSPNHLKRVMDGERNLTAPMAVRYAAALRLEDEASTYFCDLVAFNQARTSAQRNLAYQRLVGFREFRKAHQLDLAHAAYHATWYLPAIRELVLCSDFREDPVWIAKRLNPPISTTEVTRSLDILLKLGLIVRNSEGRLIQDEAIATTGSETQGLHIANYHRTMLGRASESIDLITAAERDISSLTFCAGEDDLRRIKTRIQRFRRELVAMMANVESGDQVLQLNMQLFPLTRSRPEDS